MQGNKSNSKNYLTETDLAHINESTSADEEAYVMAALTLSAKELETSIPKESNWLAIQQKMKPVVEEVASVKEHKVAVPFYFKILAVAASALCISMSWLSWNNYQLQNQLEKVLTTNRYLEQQLNQNPNSGIIYNQAMQEIGVIEKDLYNAISADMKFNLLTRRKKLMKEIIDLQKGVSNEYL